MSKNVLQALPELIRAGILSPDTAEQIRDYYRQRENKPGKVLVIVFGVLGALLTGLGLILILAHNWVELPRTIRTGLAFLPLVLAQLLGGFVLWRKAARQAWRESTATLLLLAVGASISLVSQIYHIPGDLSGFLLTWMLLGLPLVYLLRASMVSLLYLLGISWYALASKGQYPGAFPAYYYWLLLLGVLPHYYRLYRQSPAGQSTVFHHWLLPFSVAVALLTVEGQSEEWLALAFFSLFSLYCLTGNAPWLAHQKLSHNGYLVAGTLGTMGLWLAFSFEGFWVNLALQRYSLAELSTAPEFWAAILVSVPALALLVFRYRHQPLRAIDPVEASFLFFMLAFLLAFLRPSLAVVLTNLVVLFIGLHRIRQGARREQLGRLNYGLLVVAALIVCRFFDTDLSFVLRGVLFVLVGASFFGANYWMLQKRKTHEQ